MNNHHHHQQQPHQSTNFPSYPSQSQPPGLGGVSNRVFGSSQQQLQQQQDNLSMLKALGLFNKAQAKHQQQERMQPPPRVLSGGGGGGGYHGDLHSSQVIICL